MARPMTARQFHAALLSEGLKVEEVGGWRKHNRNRGPGGVRRGWGPLNGVMIHHTASAEEGITDMCRKGRAGLPGPLAHGVIHKDGVVTLVGWGRANHAGLGDARALAAVIAEAAKHPKPGPGSVDGNSRFVGFECVNLGDGGDEWPDEQVEAIVLASAAVCRFYGWTANSVIGHREWTNQKIDPAGIRMRMVRDEVGKALAAGPRGRR